MAHDDKTHCEKCRLKYPNNIIGFEKVGESSWNMITRCQKCRYLANDK